MSPGGTVSEIDTVPEKWFSAVIEMVDVVDTPTFAGVGSVDVIVKSRNWKRATAEWASEALVAVTVSVSCPAKVGLHETVAVAEPVLLVGAMVPRPSPDR